MSTKRRSRAALAATLATLLATGGPALAATPSTNASANASAKRAASSAHATIRIDVPHAKAPWVGQAIPVTVTARFRDVEQVTVEGPVRITSQGVVTSDMPREPKQWQELDHGAPSLVVRWTGTVTPGAPGPLGLAAELPVRVRFREAPKIAKREPAPEPESPLGDDPFGDPFASSMLRQMEQRMRAMSDMMEGESGPAHEEVLDLHQDGPTLTARALPTSGRPATFSGAVGTFDVATSASADHGRVAEPLTLRITVEGSGDLDRVNVSGVASSPSWKAYPPHAVDTPAGNASPRRKKTFEQTLVPLEPGALSVPPVSLAFFDPARDAYVETKSAPVTVSVEPGAAPAASAEPAPAPPASPAAAAAPARAAHVPWIPLGIGALLLAVALAVGAALRRTRALRTARSLRRQMRRAASHGSTARFAETAQDLIRRTLASRWGLLPEAVTSPTIAERLGELATPLLETLALADALRFGGGRDTDRDLRSLCGDVERTLAVAR